MSVRTVLLATVVVLASGAPIGPPSTASAELGCEPIEGVEPLLEPGRVVLVGELHGTQESPAFVGAVACHALAASRTVTIALEWPVQDAERVDAFLDSTGSDVDRDALLGGWIGAPGDQDGRRSVAMVALVETVRAMRARGHDIDVALLDDNAEVGERDQWMGEHLVAAADANPDGIVISLTGNVHSMVSPVGEVNPGFQPMGQIATTLLGERRVIAIDVAFAGGTAWACTATCGRQAFGDPGSELPAVTVVLHLDEIDAGHHGEYNVGNITASPPAVEP